MKKPAAMRALGHPGMSVNLVVVPVEGIEVIGGEAVETARLLGLTTMTLHTRPSHRGRIGYAFSVV